MRIEVRIDMGGAYGVLCPTLQIGNVSFPWTESVTSPHPTSGRQDSGDQQDATDGQPPETVMAAPEISRDQSFAEDYGRTVDSSISRVRFCEETSTGDPDVTIPVSSGSSDVRPDIVTSQPEAKVIVASVAGRRRFRDAALTVTSEIHELMNVELALDADEKTVQLGSSSTAAVTRMSDDVPGPEGTSRKILSTSTAASDCAGHATGGGRSSLLEEILRARAKTQKVS